MLKCGRNCPLFSTTRVFWPWVLGRPCTSPRPRGSRVATCGLARGTRVAVRRCRVQRAFEEADGPSPGFFPFPLAGPRGQ